MTMRGSRDTRLAIKGYARVHRMTITYALFIIIREGLTSLLYREGIKDAELIKKLLKLYQESKEREAQQSLIFLRFVDTY
ncbi:hypothetical protein ACFLVS_05320 [Chloroflexota bacterium]